MTFLKKLGFGILAVVGGVVAVAVGALAGIMKAIGSLVVKISLFMFACDLLTGKFPWVWDRWGIITFVVALIMFIVGALIEYFLTPKEGREYVRK